MAWMYDDANGVKCGFCGKEFVRCNDPHADYLEHVRESHPEENNLGDSVKILKNCIPLEG